MKGRERSRSVGQAAPAPSDLKQTGCLDGPAAQGGRSSLPGRGAHPGTRSSSPIMTSLYGQGDPGRGLSGLDLPPQVLAEEGPGQLGKVSLSRPSPGSALVQLPGTPR